MKRLLCSLLLALACMSCTFPHSKQALWTGAEPVPRADSTFVTEEDSGLMLLGVVTLTEPDHYAVLLERARRHHRCDRMHHAQLDYFTDFWLIVAFPVSRITLICERDPQKVAAPR